VYASIEGCQMFSRRSRRVVVPAMSHVAALKRRSLDAWNARGVLAIGASGRMRARNAIRWLELYAANRRSPASRLNGSQARQRTNGAFTSPRVRSRLTRIRTPGGGRHLVHIDVPRQHHARDAHVRCAIQATHCIDAGHRVTQLRDRADAVRSCCEPSRASSIRPRVRVSLFREHWFSGSMNGHFARERRYLAVNTRDGLAVLEAVKGRPHRNSAGSSP
jgi:hypothetical protein